MGKRPKPLGHDSKGQPVFAYNAKGLPVCGAKGCQSLARMENGRCKVHGGMTPVGPANPSYKHGGSSKVDITRNALLTRLATTSLSQGTERRTVLDQVFIVIAKALEAEDTNAAWKAFEQLAGSPKTTIVQQVDASIMEALGEILGEYVDAHRIDECLQRLQEAITSN
jgi:hypothetical protein